MKYLKILFGLSVALIVMFILHFVMLILFPETIANDKGAILYQPDYMFVEFIMFLIFVSVCFCASSFWSRSASGWPKSRRRWAARKLLAEEEMGR